MQLQFTPEVTLWSPHHASEKPTPSTHVNLPRQPFFVQIVLLGDTHP